MWLYLTLIHARKRTHKLTATLDITALVNRLGIKLQCLTVRRSILHCDSVYKYRLFRNLGRTRSDKCYVKNCRRRCDINFDEKEIQMLKLIYIYLCFGLNISRKN